MTTLLTFASLLEAVACHCNEYLCDGPMLNWLSLKKNGIHYFSDWWRGFVEMGPPRRSRKPAAQLRVPPDKIFGVGKPLLKNKLPLYSALVKWEKR